MALSGGFSRLAKRQVKGTAMSEVTVIVLTHNEAKHIKRCLESVSKLAVRVCVVDSFSSDDTVALAKELGAEVYVHTWKNYATQFQWALDNCEVKTPWVMRLDADEYLEPELARSVACFLNAPGEFNSAIFRRRIVFLGGSIKNGFFYPALMLRLWRTGAGTIEQRWMDEHIIVRDAKTQVLDGDLVDENLNDLNWWTQKHTGYAMREVYDIIQSQHAESTHGSLSGQASFKRFLKNKVYNKLPGGLRGGLYFFYRYVIGRGFLDGKAGFYFHFLQAFWYRVYVDAKLFELTREAEQLGTTPYQLLRDRGIL